MNRFVSIDVADIESVVRDYLTEHGHCSRVDGVRVGSPREQFAGLVGEAAYCRFLGIRWPKIDDPIDYGYDFVWAMKCVDAKTMLRHSPPRLHYGHSIYKRQYDSNSAAEIYALANYLETEHRVVFCGWIYHDEVPTLGQFFEAGTKAVADNGKEFVYETDRWIIPYDRVRLLDDFLALGGA